MKSAIDQLLENAVSRRVAPGIVALAADANGAFYEGAFGRAGLGDAPPLSPPRPQGLRPAPGR